MSSRASTALAVCFCALVSASATRADIARVVFRDERPELRGELRELTSDVAILEIAPGWADTFPLADVFSIETDVGRTSKPANTILGTFLGTWAGMVIGGLVAGCPCEYYAPPQEVFIGGAIGLVAGMGIGAIPTPTWKPVYLSPEAIARRERLRAWR